MQLDQLTRQTMQQTAERIVAKAATFISGQALVEARAAGAVEPHLEYEQLPDGAESYRLCVRAIANHMVPVSYVSLQSAPAYFGSIPEYVPVTTSVTTGRPGRWGTPLGVFDFRHIVVLLVDINAKWP